MKHRHISKAIIRHLLYLSCLLCFCNLSYGQSRIPVGSWQVHVPYQQAMAVADAGDRIYCVAEGGLFYYDKEFNNVQTLSKVDGLREQQISAIRYSEATKTLIVAYTNTSIDLLQGNRIININDIYRRAIAGEKAIRHILVQDKLAYLSCSFGLVVLDLEKLEIRDTYSNLGANGAQVNVSASAILRDSIYISSGEGILAARRTGVNLQDFANWTSLNTGLQNPAVTTGLVSFHGSLYTGSASQGVLKLSGKQWGSTGFATGSPIVNLASSSDYLIIILAHDLLLLDKNNTSIQVSHALLKAPQDAFVAQGNVLWAADRSKGLVKLNLKNGQADPFVPNGPYSNNSFAVYAGNGITYSVSGGYNAEYQEQGLQDGFSKYENGTWSSYNVSLYPDRATFPVVADLVSAVYNPVTGSMYFGSYGSGLLEWEEPGSYTLYNGTNSTLKSTSGGNEAVRQIRVTDVAVDASGSVWVVNRNQLANQPGLHVLHPDKTWQAYTLPGMTDGANLEHLIIDDVGQKWLTIARRSNTRTGLVVFDTEQRQLKYLSSGVGTGGLPSSAVYTIVKDLLGDIWVGTGSGVGIYYNPALVFAEPSYEAYIPIVDGRPLLDGQIIRAMAVDGGNRKWIGTDNGLWVFTPDGTELVRHFNKTNSAIPSNKILSVAIEHRSGEVFVSTEAGVASYRAGATITEGTPDCAVVYPNPVRKDFSGMIGIAGLANNAQVRITDINGTLVYKGQATGGTFTWDARSYNGKRVKAGVYLALSSDAEGKQACVSKIAILD
ncbi:hypothetical protein [Pontibacter sp. SGAir0037]|uniref:type IX secretion system anionic LPS delivery protein PorZ n=1 Tax=Pontibacter sp. SGAir0037 TaxID=2571030 RepID=UPI0010CD4664|nr:hypothetical protein [Pontibacter sp. SGAir0037]QCR23662.1 hypothetical protein C1N53_15805 [Pontibacter sp. SGAir0037]